VYLTQVSAAFAAVLFRLIGREANQIASLATEVGRVERISPALEPTLEEWEHRVEVGIRENRKIPETEREALIQARRGQGRFRANVQDVERACRVTKVQRLEHLVASHVKPWRDSFGGDHLFDKGFISFENNGDLILSPVADRTSMLRMGIAHDRALNVGGFTDGQRRFLDYHRNNVLRMSSIRRR